MRETARGISSITCPSITYLGGTPIPAGGPYLSQPGGTPSKLPVPNPSQGYPIPAGGTPSSPGPGWGNRDMGYPPNGGQTKNITSHRITYAGGNNILELTCVIQ